MYCTSIDATFYDSFLENIICIVIPLNVKAQKHVNRTYIPKCYLLSILCIFQFLHVRFFIPCLFRTWEIVALHNFPLYCLAIFVLLLSHSLFFYLFYTSTLGWLLAFSMSCECHILQALFIHDASQKLQPSLSDSKC